MKDPKPLFAIICETGEIFADEDDDRPAIFQEHIQAEEYLDVIASAGWKCACDTHRIIEYRSVSAK